MSKITCNREYYTLQQTEFIGCISSISISIFSFDQGTAVSDFQNSDVACILQPERKENADCAFVFGFLTCFCCNILAGLLALYLANEVWIEMFTIKRNGAVISIQVICVSLNLHVQWYCI